jgi:hypothetical protein
MGKIKKNGPKIRNKNINASSRLDAIKADTERLLLSMQFFCLDPRLELYNEICSSKTVQNQQADFINLWKNAAISTYGDAWGMLNDDIETAQNEHRFIVDKLTNTKIPTSETADKLWYIFFATGKVDDLENIWALSGARMIDPQVANIMADRYVTFKGAYKDKVYQTLSKNTKYLTDHPMSPYPLLASTAFEEMQKRIDKMHDDIDDAGDLESLIKRVNNLAPQTADTETETETDGKTETAEKLDHLKESIEDTEEIKTKKEKLRWLVNEYNKIEKNIINKKK